MAHRESSDSSSVSGVSYPAGSSSSAMTQKDIKYSLDSAKTNSLSLRVFNGHAVEVGADNSVWDTVSSSYLFPGRDFNPQDVHRS